MDEGGNQAKPFILPTHFSSKEEMIKKFEQCNNEKYALPTNIPMVGVKQDNVGGSNAELGSRLTVVPEGTASPYLKKPDYFSAKAVPSMPGIEVTHNRPTLLEPIELVDRARDKRVRKQAKKKHRKRRETKRGETESKDEGKGRSYEVNGDRLTEESEA